MLTPSQERLIKRAIKVIADSYQREDLYFTNVQAVKNFCRLKLGMSEHEIFAALFLDNQHCLIKYEELSIGTIDSAGVYPREVVKKVLAYNAAAVIFTHCHPSGVVEPSPADRSITERLRQALSLIDVRVLDHIIVSQIDTTSFAERGLL